MKNSEELILNNREEVCRLAKGLLKKWRAHIELDELTSVVDLSLCQAAARFDPARGTRFASFCFYYLKGNLVRLIVDRRSVAGRSEDLEKVESAIEHDSVLWEPINGSSAISSPTETTFVFRELAKNARATLEALDEVERSIVKGYYYLGLDTPELAVREGISRSYVSQIKSRALRKLRGASV